MWRRHALCGVYRALKEQLQSRKPYAVGAICSSYLPEWRPNTDYRQVYSAQRRWVGASRWI